MKEKINLVDWKKIDKINKKITKEIKEDKYIPDIIISIVRGGMIPSVLISHKLNVRNVLNITIKETVDDTINSKKLKPKISNISLLKEVTGKKILVVDDIVGSGETLKELKKEVIKYSPTEIRTAIFFINEVNWKKSNNDINYKGIVDYIGEKLKGWVVFPWEIKEN